MNDSASSAEGTLCAAYKEETGHYTQALQMADALATALQQGQGFEDKVRQIVVQLDEIARLEALIAEPKRHWQQSGRKPAGEFKNVLAQVTQLIERLADKIRAAEQMASLRQQCLVPELDSLIRGKQMRSAYGAAITNRQ
jgi:hypothetical protein